MKKFILSVLVLVPMFAAQAQEAAPAPAAPSPAPEAVCAKVEEKERPACTEAMQMFSTVLNAEQWATFTGCLGKTDPLTQDAAKACLTPDLEAALQAYMEAEMKKQMEAAGGVAPAVPPPAPAPAPEKAP